MPHVQPVDEARAASSARACPVHHLTGGEIGEQERKAPAMHPRFQSDGQTSLDEAAAYARLYHHEHGTLAACAGRSATIGAEIERTGTYRHTYAELAHGARVAWRNNTRCIGRLHWASLEVRDLRHLATAEEVFAALVEHLRLATNGGKVRSIISVFAPQLPGEPGIRIWNPQLIRYAGYRQPDGSVVGDPLHIELTDAVLRLGWTGARGSPFDVLPLVIEMPDAAPRLFELPPDAVREVPISHPDYPWFAGLGLKWHVVPVISNMRLEIGGITYTAAPFNGWYMSTEVAARNLGDVDRYNMLPLIAQQMGLDTRSDRTLWKDRALVELNVAVLHSFTMHGATMVDHHTASRQFMRHQEREKQAGRITPALWSWIVPPLSGSATPVFHQSYKNVTLTPNFFYQPDPWRQAALHRQSGACPITPLERSA